MKSLYLVISLSLSSCGCGATMRHSEETIRNQPQPKTSGRFICEGFRADSSYFQMITDKETGAQYLTRSGGGFIKLESTNMFENTKIINLPESQ